jgi:hypothetical protein
MKYPQFVWVLCPGREGFVSAQIWWQEMHTDTFLAGGKREVVPHAAKHEMQEGDETLGAQILKRIFPPPAGYKEWKL